MTKEMIVAWFKDNEEVFNECIEDLDSYNGYLGDDRYYCMDELDELYSGVAASEVLARAFFGRDDDTWTVNSYGEKEYGSFNPNRDYFRYNGYGNLCSSDYKDYSYFLDEHFIDSLIENRGNLYCIDDNPELAEMFDALEDNETETETAFEKVVSVVAAAVPSGDAMQNPEVSNA